MGVSDEIAIPRHHDPSLRLVVVLVSGGDGGGDGESEIHLYGVIEREKISIPLTMTNSPNLCRLLFGANARLKDALLVWLAYLEVASHQFNCRSGNPVSVPLENENIHRP